MLVVMIILTLLATGQININDVYNGSTCLDVVCSNGHVELVELLLQVKDIDVNHEDQSEFNSFFYACLSGRIEIMELLIATGEIDINKQDSSGNSCLHYAASLGRVEPIKILLRQNNIDIHAKNKFGNTILHNACSPTMINSQTYECYGHFEAVKILAQAGVAIGALNNQDEKASDITNDKKIKDFLLDLEDLSKKLINTKAKTSLAKL